MHYTKSASSVLIACVLLSGCESSNTSVADYAYDETTVVSEYIIGPGDTLDIFVWKHADVTTSVPVRPDGRISTPLVEDMVAVGKTPNQLARDMEVALSDYIRSPTVNVIVKSFVGTFSNQVRVLGQAMEPRAIPYQQQMTLLDVMIAVGGLAENAAGNRAKVIRKNEGRTIEIPVRLNDLINKGNIASNIEMHPGDVLIIPESWL